jgi:RNA polymerase sigma-B factor
MPHDSTGGPDGSKEVLFRAFRRSRSRRIRNELVERHLHLVDYHVRRYASRGVAAEDVRQVASIALVLAVERFDPDVGVAFSTFASRTIDGECKRYLRDRTWGVRPPRRMQELHLAARRQQELLTHVGGRPPTVAELASALDETEEHVLEALEAGQARYALSVDHPVEATGRAISDSLVDTYDLIDSVESRVVVSEVISSLCDRDRWIIEQRFFHRRTQSEIAAEMGISQSYLSRVVNRILEQLRRQLAEVEERDAVDVGAG